MSRAILPCGTCGACCMDNQIVMLGPDENLDEYEHRDGNILNQPNGDCYYLDRGLGCRIWDRAPKVCQVFNCTLPHMAYTPRIRAAVLRLAREAP